MSYGRSEPVHNGAMTAGEIGKDTEKTVNSAESAIEVPAAVDADGEVKQDGVRRTEAITSSWDKKTLVFMCIS